jgi:3-deoxy-7-phosphoheptulonate synthase
MVDASHGNSEKDYRRQPIVAEALAEQIAAGEQGLAGVMLESFLEAGHQEPGPLEGLVYGQSITDACMDMATTGAVLNGLAAAVRNRRGTVPEPTGREPGHTAGGEHAGTGSSGQPRATASA